MAVCLGQGRAAAAADTSVQCRSAADQRRGRNARLDVPIKNLLANNRAGNTSFMDFDHYDPADLSLCAVNAQNV